jgi:DNA polymerase III epsilon subunit-like protein
MLVAVDLETSKFDREMTPYEDVLIDLSLFFVDDNFKEIKTVTGRYKPLSGVSPLASSLHGITDEDLKDCKSAMESKESLQALFNRLNENQNVTYVWYNTTFDFRVLKTYGINIREDKVIDVLRLVKFYVDRSDLVKEFDNFQLAYMYYKLGLHKDTSLGAGRNAHDALSDCKATLLLLKFLLKDLNVKDHNDVTEMLTGKILYDNILLGYQKGKKFAQLSDEELKKLANFFVDDKDIQYTVSFILMNRG